MKSGQCVTIFMLGLCLSTVGYSAGKTTKRPKFPDSTILGGVRVRDSVAQVETKLGTNCLKIIKAVEQETPTCISVYNDPQDDARILIDWRATEWEQVESVCAISLVKGRVRGEYFASRPFARLGDYYGLKLGSTQADIERVYDNIWRHNECGPDQLTIDVDSPEPRSSFPCSVEFTLEHRKVIRIFSGYRPYEFAPEDKVRHNHRTGATEQAVALGRFF